MARLATIGTRVAHQPFTKAIWDQLKATSDYLVVAGGDLASAATLAITNEFHKVTGNVTIDNISDALTASAGQQVRLWFTGTPTIRSNGGGTGNIRTGGGDRAVVANEILLFQFDGTNWRLMADAAAQIDYAQITSTPAAVTTTTEGTATTIITGNSVSYDGTRVKVEVFFPMTTLAVSGGRIVVFRDSTVVGQFSSGSNGNGQPISGAVFDTPSAGAHTYTVKAFTNGANNLTLSAGPGGSGQLVPAFLRVTKA